MKNQENFIVRKSSGKEEYFSFEKLERSLIQAKATEYEAKDIINQLKQEINSDISSDKLYSMAFRKLKKHAPHKAARYHLKKGIMELGPSGFPFEQFICALFREKGFIVQTDVHIVGKCVNHEVDILASKENHINLMECKYKNMAGLSVDVKVPLYINSRFQDIQDTNFILPEQTFQGWIVTNVRFTSDAIQYSNCRGIKLISWDYPNDYSLKSLIDETKLYPLTCLTLLTSGEKKILLDKGLLLVRDLCSEISILEKIGITSRRIKRIATECSLLCS
jgi:hypothetical protein